MKTQSWARGSNFLRWLERVEAKAKQPKAGTSARGRRKQSTDEEESDVSEPRPSKGKGKAVASGSAKVTKATSRRIAEVSHAELPSIATNPRNEIEQLKVWIDVSHILEMINSRP